MVYDARFTRRGGREDETYQSVFIILSVLVAAAAYAGEEITSTLPNQDRLTNSIRTMPFDKVAKIEAADEYALYHTDRVISPISPVLVRQDTPGGPRYQEALGYTFLLNSVKFPAIARMDDGLLVLSLSAESTPGKREGFLLFSKDDGSSWTQPRHFPGYRSKPINLGGRRLLMGSRTSDDAGETWRDLKPFPSKLPGGRTLWRSDMSYTPLVEGDAVAFACSAPLGDENNWKTGEPFSQGLLWRFHLDTQEWDPPYFFPKDWPLNEGSILRAANGDLVASFRTQMIGVPIDSDNWMGLATLRSTDNGKTWSEPAYHFLYGCHHTNLILLPDGRILMTYVSRIGELDGMTYHGVEAVLSSDHGATWDWKHRYILFRWPYPSTHSPQSVRLSDGRILTVLMHDTNFSWTDTGKHPYEDKLFPVFIGNVSVVIWSPL